MEFLKVSCPCTYHQVDAPVSSCSCVFPTILGIKCHCFPFVTESFCFPVQYEYIKYSLLILVLRTFNSHVDLFIGELFETLQIQAFFFFSYILICDSDNGVTSRAGIVLYCIVLYCGRVPAANAPGCTAAEGLLYKPWSLVVRTCTARCLHQRPQQ